jgi:hypothetical protein
MTVGTLFIQDPAYRRGHTRMLGQIPEQDRPRRNRRRIQARVTEWMYAGKQQRRK